MNSASYYTTKLYAEHHGLKAAEVRYHCLVGNLECIKLAGSGHGCYMIPEGAEIKKKKVGRKIGYRKPKGGVA